MRNNRILAAMIVAAGLNVMAAGTWRARRARSPRRGLA